MNRLRNAVLTTGAAVGVLCLALTIVALSFGMRPLVFTSGSMSPEIPAGSLGVARTVAAGNLDVGDIVSVRSSAGQRVTHRVVSISGQGPAKRLVLQGDTNPEPDPETYIVDEVDRIVLTVPTLGSVLGFLKSGLGLALLSSTLAAMMLIGFGGNCRIHTHRARRRGRVFITFVTVVGLAVASISAANAAFHDEASVSTQSVTAGAVPKPTITGCAVSGIIVYTVTVTFQADRPPRSSTGFLNYNARLVQSNQNLTISGTGTTRTVSISSNVLGDLLGGFADIEIIARLPEATQWVSPPSVQRVNIALTGIPFCGSAT